MGDCKHGEYQPQEGTWTLMAPDGRQWQASSGMLAAAKEQSERIPVEVMLARILEPLESDKDELDAARYRWLRDSPNSGAMLRLLYEDGQATPKFCDEAIDASMPETPNVEVRRGPTKEGETK